MASIPKLSPPDSLGAMLAPIAHLTEEEFAKLARATSRRRSFQIKSKEVKELSNEVPLLINLPFTLGALAFIYARLEPYRDKTSLADIVTGLVDDFEIKCEPHDRQKLEHRLTRLLERNEAFDRSKKLLRLETGFLPNATGFRSFVDLRPDFGGEEALNFEGFVKIVQFRIRTDADSKRAKEFVFQVSEDALDELQLAIDRARAKLRALDEIPAISDQILSRAT